MSTLVIVRKGNKAVIAADSLCSQGSIKISSSHKTNHHKIHKIHDAYIGFTGWCVMKDIFESVAEKYPTNINFSSRRHIFDTLVFLHTKLKEDYFLETDEKENQPVQSSQWDGLLISKAGIFSFGSWREVNEYDTFWADGSGIRFALGAMRAVYDTSEDAEEIALTGIKVACEFDQSSALPHLMHTVTLDPSSE